MEKPMLEVVCPKCGGVNLLTAEEYKRERRLNRFICGYLVNGETCVVPLRSMRLLPPRAR